MNLGFDASYEAFREEVRTFLGDAWLAGPKGQATPDAERAFRRLAVERGYLYRSVPRAYGGSEQAPDILKAQIIREEFRRAGAPGEVIGIGTQMLVPTLLECGEAWQKEMFVRRTLDGEISWCQGYSEPGAGSDLASLRTRAELVGDQWVLNGQKVWTSHARRADYMFALVRTEPDAGKHAGLSYLLLEVQQPGVEVRPLKQINGSAEFNEVFFTDAKTPASWIVGARGEGWQVSRSLLKHERNTLGGMDRADSLFNSLLGLARRTQRDGRPSIDDPTVRTRLAALFARLQAQRLSSYIQLTRDARGQSAGLLQLLNKEMQTNLGEETARLALELIESEALLAPRRGGAEGNERWMNQYMLSLAAAIAGGTSNIQRNIIAERGLGLPRDPGPVSGAST